MIHPTHARYANYVGRVGALAFALGVGVAVANHQGVALADTGAGNDSANSPSTHAGNGSSTTGPSQRSRRPSAASISAVPARTVSSVMPNPARSTNNPTVPAAIGVPEILGSARREVAQNVQPTSVLATTDQLNAEQVATRLASSPAVQLAKAVLKAGWILAAKKNFSLVGGPDQANMAQLDQAVTEYANQAAMD